MNTVGLLVSMRDTDNQRSIVFVKQYSDKQQNKEECRKVQMTLFETHKNKTLSLAVGLQLTWSSLYTSVPIECFQTICSLQKLVRSF